MGVSIETNENSCCIRIEGELTIYKVAEYKQAIVDSSAPQRNVELDLSAVDEIDTGGLQLLAALARTVMEGGNSMTCVAVNEVASEAFELNRFAEVLNCEHHHGAQS